MRLFDWPITKKVLNFGDYPTLRVSTQQTMKDVKPQYSFTHLYRFPRGQPCIWDKVRSYWGHVTEHIGNLVMNNKKIPTPPTPHPPFSQEEELGLLDECCNSSLAEQDSGLDQWQSIKVICRGIVTHTHIYTRDQTAPLADTINTQTGLGVVPPSPSSEKHR